MNRRAMQPFSGQFTLPRLERVLAGPGAIETLAEELDRYGCRRVVVVTGATLGRSALAAQVRDVLGDRCAALFTGSRQHVPASTIASLVTRVRATGADALVSLGGGSPIDTAKGAVHALPAAGAPIHIAVPTTLSAGEFTDVAGVTDDATRIKHAVFDPRLAPRTVIADPVVSLSTPDWLWAASGIRALDHAIETLYSSRCHPIAEPLAIRAIEMLRTHLPASLHGPADDRVAHRGECQMAAWLAVFGVTNAGFGLSHALGHQIGPRWNVPHGVTSSVMLPHAMRFMAEAAPERFRGIARAFGVDFGEPFRSARACADRAAAFIEGFGLPMRLRDLSIAPDELGEIAGYVAEVMSRAGVVPRPVGPADVRAVLDAAY